MKNTQNLHLNMICITCNLQGFFCYKPTEDHCTCPSCGKYDHLSINSELDKYQFLYEDINDIRRKFQYCDNCQIIYQVGCMHSCLGYTDNVYNAHVIKRWKFNNVEYEGMPKFDDVNDWFNNSNNIEILEMYCVHKNDKCVNTRYDFTDKCNV